MKILSFKPGHDGSIAFIEDGSLIFCFEAEHDSFPRHETVTPELFLNALGKIDCIPDIVADGGWCKEFDDYSNVNKYAAGYSNISEDVGPPI